MNNTFGKPIIPENEEGRIKDLNSYVTLDGYPDKYFNEIAKIIAQSFGMPIALISLVGNEYVEFKGNFGMEGTNRADRGVSLCSLAVLDPQPTIFNDALQEPCLLSNPLVTGSFGLRFYAGVPLTTAEGYNIGSVCVVDQKVRSFSDNDVALLTRFANNVMEELENRRIKKASTE
ncbi:MAG: GAF domain-containing protein [Bacteroidota bacterium]